MIDNFDLIKPLFYFNEANNMFFHCQIVCRTKDHPGQKFQDYRCTQKLYGDSSLYA